MVDMGSINRAIISGGCRVALEQYEVSCSDLRGRGWFSGGDSIVVSY